MGASIRINKFLAERGLCSRREADRWLEEGRVFINDRVAKPGDQVTGADRITVDGEEVPDAAKPFVYLAYNKPRGVECTADPDNPDNLSKAIGYPDRVFSIGRLDKFSEGLLLLTNDGGIVNRLLKGKFGHEKIYLVDTNGEITDDEIARLEEGVEIEGRLTRPSRIERLKPRLLRITLVEGINRQIRRMLELIDLKAQRIKRVHFAGIDLSELESGKWRPLTATEVEILRNRE